MKRAFTLIELLIVVAIIAILAAIAVPNFLEAQTRAKVSRAKSDMRTYATAIEAYTVDYTRAPLGFTERGLVPGNIAIGNRHLLFRYLTTPVAYLTSLPTDPFGEKIVGRNEAFYYFFNTFYNTASFGSTQFREELRAKGYYWVLYSLGPNRSESAPWVEDMLHDGGAALATGTTDPNDVMLDNIYDPTNGTVSRGKIYRTNKGIVTELP